MIATQFQFYNANKAGICHIIVIASLGEEAKTSKYTQVVKSMRGKYSLPLWKMLDLKLKISVQNHWFLL